MNEYVSYAPLTNSSILFDLETEIGAVHIIKGKAY